jgi:hypothetical protein
VTRGNAVGRHVANRERFAAPPFLPFSGSKSWPTYTASFLLVCNFAYASVLKMETVCSCETSATCRTARRFSQETVLSVVCANDVLQHLTGSHDSVTSGALQTRTQVQLYPQLHRAPDRVMFGIVRSSRKREYFACMWACD